MYLVLMYLLLDLSYVPSSVVVTSAPPRDDLDASSRLAVNEGPARLEHFTAIVKQSCRSLNCQQ